MRTVCLIPIEDLRKAICKNLYFAIKTFDKLGLNLKTEELTGIVKFPSGNKYYYKNGLRHREDGPAFEHYCGYKEWYLNGKFQRWETADGEASKKIAEQ